MPRYNCLNPCNKPLETCSISDINKLTKSPCLLLSIYESGKYVNLLKVSFLRSRMKPSETIYIKYSYK